MGYLVKKEILDKWDSVIKNPRFESLPKLNQLQESVVAQSLENTDRMGYFAEAKRIKEEHGLISEQFPTNAMGTSSSTSGTGNIDTFDPILISLVRRTTPNLIAYDLCGVQPMTGPTGIIFALRSRYGSMTGPENFFNEVNTGWTGWPGANMTSNGAGATISGGYANNTVPGGAAGNLGGVPGVSNNSGNAAYNYAGGFTTAGAEGLGYGNSVFPEMSLSIEKTTVTARERALKAEYSIEIAQDLKAIHGLEIESELTNILSSEILAEINREVIRTIVVTAKAGCQLNVTTPGIFDLDTDSDGRWLVEKFKGLMFRIDLEANAIAKATRRGKGNVILCSSNVASALVAAGVLQFTPKLNNDLMVDDTGNTFAGVLNGRYKVYIDPYATGDYMVVGYKGSSAFDAGIFYCPYIPLQLLKAIDPNTMQPKIGFKTRYGMVANPFAQGLTVGQGALIQDSNVFYNRSLINNLM
jgi:hypothetical protein